MYRNRLIWSLLVLLGGVGALPATAGWEEGVAAFRAGNLERAAREFRQVVEQRDDWPGGHFMLGRTLMRLGQTDQALSHLRRAYDLDPNDVSIQLALGQAFVERRLYGDAIELFNRLDIGAMNAAQRSVFFQLQATALERSGRERHALDALRRAASAAPNDSDVQFRYGLAAFRAGDTQAAVQALEKAVGLDARDARKRKTYVEALLRLGRERPSGQKAAVYRRAVDAAQQLVRTNSTYDHILLLGEAQLGARQYQNAVRTFERAASGRDSEWLPHFYIGQAHTALQQYPQAQASLRRAQNRTTDSANQVRIWRQLGFVYEKQRDWEQARVAYNRAGDSASVQRVVENQRIHEHNLEVEEETRRLEELEREAERLRRELEELPGGRPPSRR